MRRAVATTVLVCSTLALGGALAQEPPPAQPGPELDNSTRAAARVLGEAGVDLFHQGDYEGALAKFQKAEEIARVPTLGLRIARCLEKLGRLVEARDKYHSVAGSILEFSAPRPQHEAVEQARGELAALGPRIPSIEIELVGPDVADAEVSVDGKLVPPPARQRVLLDPGMHRVVGRRGGDTASQEVSLRDGESVRVLLRFGARTESASPRPAPVLDEPDATIDGAEYRTGAWVAFGIGAAGAGLFAIAGGLALGKQSDLVDRCPNDVCAGTSESDVQSFETLRVLSLVGLGVAIVGAGVGVTLFALAPSAATSARLDVGPGNLSIRGAF